jgi:hypothetical protein
VFIWVKRNRHKRAERGQGDRGEGRMSEKKTRKLLEKKEPKKY